eukprot:TRINITY_DN1257_c1_g1_i14.p1 TRINITY_DN1257_c1_g1~~TRINITY_DN1257_c1_g1_i14.p1  ORF type:complete len:744 (+),score=144.67 TRINITY_DN1257_c1_g1_i14:59-2290(+)
MSREEREGLRIQHPENIPLSGMTSPFLPHRKFKDAEKEEEKRSKHVKKLTDHYTPYKLGGQRPGFHDSMESITSAVSHSRSMRASSFEVRDMANILSSWSTPIHQAAEEGRNDQLNLLLEYPDLDVNIQTKIYNDYEGIIVVHNTPLHLAAANAHPGAVTLLLKYGARVDIQNADGSTPLHVAVANGVPLEIVHSLVKVGSALGKKDNKGRTALFTAAEEGWSNIVPVLVSAGENIEETDITGETPLIAATKNGFSNTIKVLIESGASIFTRDKQGKNALGYALEVNERTIQDEQVFDVVLSGMLKEESEENALKQMHSLLRKYQKLHLKKSITCLLNRIPTLKARKVIVRSYYLENDSRGSKPTDKEFSYIHGIALQMLAETEDHDLAYHPTVRVIVDKKMSKIGNYYLLIEIIYFLVFLSSLFYILTAAVTKQNPLVYVVYADVFRGIFEGVVAIFWVVSLLLEIAEVVGETRHVYQRILANSQDKSSVEIENSLGTIAKEVATLYLREPYNYFDLLGLLLLFLILPLRIADTNYQWIFASLAVIIHFLRFIKVLRLLPGFGTYVHTITLIIIKDVPKFAVVSGMIMLVASEAFFLALRAPYSANLPPKNSTLEQIMDGSEGMFNQFYWTFLLFVRLLLQGENVLDGNYLFDSLNWLDAIIYLTTLTLVIVVLLNIFIAQVTDTYAAAKAKSQRIVSYYRLKFVVKVLGRSLGTTLGRYGYLGEIIMKSNEWKEYQEGRCI